MRVQLFDWNCFVAMVKNEELGIITRIDEYPYYFVSYKHHQWVITEEMRDQFGTIIEVKKIEDFSDHHYTHKDTKNNWNHLMFSEVIDE